jgi:hypothetical protein
MVEMQEKAQPNRDVFRQRLRHIDGSVHMHRMRVKLETARVPLKGPLRSVTHKAYIEHLCSGSVWGRPAMIDFGGQDGPTGRQIKIFVLGEPRTRFTGLISWPVATGCATKINDCRSAPNHDQTQPVKGTGICCITQLSRSCSRSGRHTRACRLKFFF